MTYEQANKIGTVVEGYVKCTYAMLYDLKSARVFSIQHSDSSRNTARNEFNATVGAASDLNADEIFYIEDFAVVQTDPELEQPKDDRFAAVRLTEKGVEILNQKSKRTKKEKYYNMKLFSVYDVFHVKKCAIDWIPTNVDNAQVTFMNENGETITNLNADIEVSKKKYENAKAILAAAATFNLF